MRKAIINAKIVLPDQVLRNEPFSCLMQNKGQTVEKPLPCTAQNRGFLGLKSTLLGWICCLAES